MSSKNVHTGKLYSKDNWQMTAFGRMTSYIDKIDKSSISNILDLGCRNGRATEQLSLTFPKAKITAIETNEQRLEEAVKRNANNPNISHELLALQQVEELINRGVKYDLINANFSLHWLSKEEKYKLFSNLEAITADKSHIIIGSCQQFPTFIKVLDCEIKKYLGISLECPHYLHYFNYEEWTDFLKEYGYKVSKEYQWLDLHPVRVSADLYDPENYLASWLFGVSTGKAAYGRKPEDFSKEFIDGLLELIINHYGCSKYYDIENDCIRTEFKKGMKLASFTEETLTIAATKGC